MDQIEKDFQVLRKANCFVDTDKCDRIYRTTPIEIDMCDHCDPGTNGFLNDKLDELKSMLKEGEKLVNVDLDREYDAWTSKVVLVGYVREKNE